MPWAMPWAPAEALMVSNEQLVELERLVRAPKTPQKVVLRARIVLAAAEGRSNNAIAAELSISRPTVILWRERMDKHGLERILADATRPGRRKALDPEVVARVIDATLGTKPVGGTHWSIREMAAAQVSARRRCSASGRHMASNPICWSASSSPPTPTSRTSCATSSASI